MISVLSQWTCVGCHFPFGEGKNAHKPGEDKWNLFSTAANKVWGPNNGPWILNDAQIVAKACRNMPHMVGGGNLQDYRSKSFRTATSGPLLHRRLRDISFTASELLLTL